MATDRGYQAVVEKIVPNGRHGPYAVARSKELGTITFALDGNVWQEGKWPDRGSCVMLSRVRKKRAGWRAEHGRFFEPSDEQQPETKEKQ